MAKVRFLQNAVVAGVRYAPGAIVEMADDMAAVYRETRQIEPIENETKPPARPAKKRGK